MPYRSNIFIKGNFYHVFNRGAGRDRLFFNPDNYVYCLRLIKRYAERYQIRVIAYCLMPNHYHFLLRQDGNVPISKFINVLFNAYVQAVNRQQGRKGTLFEGRFRHVWVDREEYLVHLCRYIHLNPVKANLVPAPQDWLYSNYQEWVGTRSGTLIDKSFVKTWFETGEDYRRFVQEGLDGEEALPQMGMGRYLL